MTDTSNKVLVVKVDRSAAGITVPFDKLYFFPKGRATDIPKIFGYALVFPCETTLMSAIVKLRPKTISAYRHRRDDALLNQPIDLDGRKTTETDVATWWQTHVLTVYNMEERVVVVPVLTSKIRKKLNPRYLAASKYFEAGTPVRRTRTRSKRPLKVIQKASSKQAISEFAYLATPLEAPNDRVSPICNICPRQLLQLQGLCTPGQPVCLKALNFNDIGTSRAVDAAVPEGVDEGDLETAQQADEQEVEF